MDKAVTIYKQKPTEEVVSSTDDQVELKLLKSGRKKILTRLTFIGRYDLYITLGFVYHPAVAMWLGHEIALEQYLNAHIEEWVVRGHNNTMQLYSKKDSYRKPAWCSDPTFHESHKSNLLTKERDRKEKEWYINLKEFKGVEHEQEYLWPYSEKYDTEHRYV